MTARRSSLCVPASEAARIPKALLSDADEVVVDLEDAVPLDLKSSARDNIATIIQRTRGTVAVRVNAPGSPWIQDDLRAAARNPAVSAVVVPKTETSAQLREIGDLLSAFEAEAGRADPVRLHALIESPRGVSNVSGIAASTSRMEALVLGYADLAASMGRRIEGPWAFAQDAVLLAARSEELQALDGPMLTVADDEALARAAFDADALGFDGKWVIHPRQIGTVQSAFSPTAEAVDEARGIIDALERAAREGRGAVEWHGRMLDEAVAVQARRTVTKASA